MVQVVAHFLDPRAALRAAARLLRPGGYCLIETWDRDSWTARLWGRRWHEYSPPSVLHWFSRAGLIQLARECELEQVALGHPRKWLNAAHAASILRAKLGRRSGGGVAVRLLERLPARAAIPYPAEDLFWVLFQKTERT
jgi:SAM-dependent methyltransferase